MKKVLTSFILFTILFNFICCYHVYAEDPDSEFLPDGAAKYLIDETTQFGDNDISDMLDSGQSGKTSSNQYDILEDRGLLGTVVGLFGFALSILPLLGEIILTFISGNLSVESTSYFTIEKVVFNQVGMLNCDFFDFGASYNVGEVTVNVPGYIQEAKTGVAQLYFVMRYLSVALSLVLLIYIGIRMGISTVAEEEARYKKMFQGWIESIIILFLMHYLIAALFAVSNVLLEGCWKIYTSLNDVTNNNFEEKLINSIYSTFSQVSGVGVIYFTVSLWVLAYTHVKFFWLYIKRFFMTGFLIAVSPLITITYSIDKAGDGKAQAFQTWFRELSITAFIQPIHCVIYMVFNETAGEIAKVAPILSLIFLVLITYVEKVVRKLIFSKDKSIVVGGIDEAKEGIKKGIEAGGGLIKQALEK